MQQVSKFSRFRYARAILAKIFAESDPRQSHRARPALRGKLFFNCHEQVLKMSVVRDQPSQHEGASE
eukprot:323906-Pleurochrysis_carterae.AAC.2